MIFILNFIKVDAEQHKQLAHSVVSEFGSFMPKLKKTFSYRE